MSEHDVPVAMIAALSRNRVIGADNKMPWHLPEDLGHFKRLTWQKPIIMGRNTFESIGRPLPSRHNIVLTRDPAFAAEGVVVCRDWPSALAAAQQYALEHGAEEVMVIGGGQVYAEAMPDADRLYLTEIRMTVEGDTRFPLLEDDVWQEQERVAGNPDEGQPYYDFVTYVRQSR
ncbi:MULTISPECIES: dihydrofolate reductase [unclassified Zymobacter]|uniref:dihydrofolate reductase n=1 Tax=unclassified Zymobacter TaxID=3048685 RepID=UPI0039C45D39